MPISMRLWEIGAGDTRIDGDFNNFCCNKFPSSLAMALSVCSVALCASTFLWGSTSLQVNRGESNVTCKKADIHSKFYNDAKVYCNGELVMTTGSEGEKGSLRSCGRV